MKGVQSMKALAINGSPREEGNTFNMLNTVLDVLKNGGVETELYQAGGQLVKGCMACSGCSKNKGVCVTNDWVNELYVKMKEADAIIIGSPTYFADLTPEIKAIIDRTGFMSRRDSFAFSRKIGAGVAAVRRAGGIPTLESIQNFFLINDMIVPGSTYWNMSLALHVGDYQNDQEGLGTMNRLGENILWLMEKIKD